jgi:hypothetical protein
VITVRLGAALAAIVMGLSACAVVEWVPLGTPQAAVIERYGAPSRVVPLPSGTRLQYTRQPMGQTAVMVDLDAAGQVVSVRQVLNANDFARIEVGQWTRETTEREFGRPAWVNHVASWTGDILTYRWRDGSIDMLYYVYLDPGNVVQKVGQGMEFIDVYERRDGLTLRLGF